MIFLIITSGNVIRGGEGQFVDRDSKLSYIGEWEVNKRSGLGKILSLETGEVIYDGGFLKNKKCGMGKLKKGDETYVGMFNM